MNEAVSDILNGRFRQSGKGLEFSCSGINGKVREGLNFSGTFTVRSVDSVPVKCTVLSDTDRLSFAKSEFDGDTFEVDYEFDARFLQSGTTVRARIYFVTDEGEYSMPVQLEVVRDS
ncbi:MAG: DUF5717 family protein, partial [Lachnospiraceae bacterium]|nr:DUF5717 family protein [Lachnospiraceae bacterium]